jgi:DNA polymerase I
LAQLSVYVFLIAPEPGKALVHQDYSQQEVRIAAVNSGDSALLAACETGDIYLGIAERLGFDPARPGLRDLFKIVVLAIQYGAGPMLLSSHAGISRYEAGEIITRLKARFRVFREWCDNIADYAGLNMALTSEFGWSVRCPPGTSNRTIRNWPVQTAGSEILHVCCILAERRSIRIVAPIHDAFVAECETRDVADVSAALDRCMRDASAVVLRGYELPTSDDDGKGLILPVHLDARRCDNRPMPPVMRGRYYDKRGAAMWTEINRLMDNLDQRVA